MTQDLSTNIEKAIAHLKKQYSALQAGKANTSMVEDIQVESYGAMSPIKNVANISIPDPKTIRIEPWDKSIIGELERAIQAADIGINPQNMGESILLPIPPMTEDRRKQLVKVAHEEAENAKISIRNIRSEARDMVKLQKDEKEISEDEAAKADKDIQEKIDDANKTIDDLCKAKEKDILTI